jgi:hypothetical protein
MVADEKFTRPLLVFAQTAELRSRLTGPQVSALDYNVYVRRSDPTATLSSVYNVPTDFQSPEELRGSHPEFDSHSQTFPRYFGPLFRGDRLSRYELLPDFPAATSSAPLPREIRDLLGWSDQKSGFPGTFPIGK